MRSVPEHQGLHGFLAAILDAQGDTAGVAALRAKLGPDDAPGIPNWHYCYYLSKRDFAAAAYWLEKCIGHRDTRAPWILPHLAGPAFTASPHWPPLARKMGLPPSAWTRFGEPVKARPTPRPGA